MKPVAIVDGQKIQVEGISYYDNKPQSVMLYPNYKTLYLDRDPVTLVWEDRYAPVIEAIRKQIDAHEERMNDLAIQFIESDRPFEVEIQKKYHQLNEQVHGLRQALALAIEQTKQNENLEVI